MYIWLILTIIFLILEGYTTALISIWFALAAGILTLVSGYIPDIMKQFYLFVTLSFVFIIVTRTLSKKLLSKRKEKIESRIIGQVVEVKSVISPGDYEIYLDGKHWKAKCDEELHVGDKAKVLKIQGIKLILEKE
ncbi:NfeD family protein [Ilyobacter sp.]|uniref:NfeD family protein n=1 Tax=Ilyobacter sp. TaxID=3100343 RepID=UPI003565F86E